MPTTARIAAIAASSALLVAISGAAATAAHVDGRAGSRSWTTIGTYEGAKHQACKELVNGGATWKVYNRLVNGDQTRIGANMAVLKNGEQTTRTWESGLIAKGRTSALGWVFLPKGNPAYTLQHGEHAAQSGTGGIVRIGAIGRC